MPTAIRRRAGMSAIHDPDGEFLRYIVYDKDALAKFFTPDGVRFPCPIPLHPEKLNDIGILRMRVCAVLNPVLRDPPKVKIKLYLNERPALRYDTWIRLKAGHVQGDFRIDSPGAVRATADGRKESVCDHGASGRHQRVVVPAKTRVRARQHARRERRPACAGSQRLFWSCGGWISVILGIRGRAALQGAHT